jgi:Ferritin-like domain
MDRRPTRRGLMRDGIRLGSGTLAAGTLAAGSLAAGADAAEAIAAPTQDETQALIHALELEQVVVIAYQQVVASAALRPGVRSQLQTVLGQEREHVRLLERALISRGRVAPVPPSIPSAQAVLTRHQVHWSLTQARSQHDGLKLLVDAESLVENAYFQAVATVADPGLLRTCAEIMGCEAQHWTILSGLLNHRNPMKAVPYPFVEGTP